MYCADRKMSSCLDPELPGTGLQKGADAELGPLCLRKRVSWNPAEMGKHDKGQGGTPFGM
jgi:hypothetical protein